ncbi:unnamed protein product, partial [Pelagomonas calceolata]
APRHGSAGRGPRAAARGARRAPAPDAPPRHEGGGPVDGPGRAALPPARLRLRLERDLQRLQRVLRLRPARLRAQEEHQGPVVARLRARARGRARPGLEHHREPRRLARVGPRRRLQRPHVRRQGDQEAVPGGPALRRRRRRRRDRHHAARKLRCGGGRGGGRPGRRDAPVAGRAGDVVGAVTVLESEDVERDLAKAARKLCKAARRPVAFRSVAECSEAEMARVPPPGAPDRPGGLTPPRAFNLMFETRVGAAADAAAAAYLRPETAQGIFVNFKNVAATARGFGVPGGVAQIGKAFRNEITPRNFVFRSREFEQMEIEYFCSDEGDAWRACHAEWVAACRAWLVDRAGLRAELLGEDVHEDLAHYARACTDITFRFPFGEQELQGIAARGCYDLTQHQEASGKSLEYVDQASGRKYVPQVVEPSIGVDRLFLAAICSAYAVDEVGGAERTLLKFSPLLAPVKAAVLPLSKKDPALLEIARRVHDDLKRRYNVQWDAAGNIGRRYRRQDEIGTPLCITVDFDSIEDGCVTVRDRDSTDQVRVKVEDVAAHVVHVIEGL